MFNKDIKLETERLILRYLDKNDKEAIFNNINHDKEVLKYFIDKYCETVDEMRTDSLVDGFIKNEKYILAITLKETNEVIGLMLECSEPNQIFNNIELGYAIGKKHWNKGYVTEALQEMIKFEFSRGIHKVITSYFEENIASKRVMEKCHMQYEGIHYQEVYYHDKYHNLVYYYILNK